MSAIWCKCMLCCTSMLPGNEESHPRLCAAKLTLILGTKVDQAYVPMVGLINLYGLGLLHIDMQCQKCMQTADF